MVEFYDLKTESCANDEEDFPQAMQFELSACQTCRIPCRERVYGCFEASLFASFMGKQKETKRHP